MFSSECCYKYVEMSEKYSHFQDSEKYVEQLLTLFNRFSKLVKEAFQDDPRFLTARDKVSLLQLSLLCKYSKFSLFTLHCWIKMHGCSLF